MSNRRITASPPHPHPTERGRTDYPPHQPQPVRPGSVRRLDARTVCWEGCEL